MGSTILERREAIAGHEPDVLTVVEAPMNEHLDHAKVLAVVDAYSHITGSAMPWSSLVRAMYAMRNVAPEVLALSPTLLVERSLRGILTDLERLGVVSIGADGSSITDFGRNEVGKWNSHYVKRRESAIEALRTIMPVAPTQLSCDRDDIH